MILSFTLLTFADFYFVILVHWKSQSFYQFKLRYVHIYIYIYIYVCVCVLFVIHNYTFLLCEYILLPSLHNNLYSQFYALMLLSFYCILSKITRIKMSNIIYNTYMTIYIFNLYNEISVHTRRLVNHSIWVRSRRCGCLVTWCCYQLIAKPGNKTATHSWPDPSTHTLAHNGATPSADTLLITNFIHDFYIHRNTFSFIRHDLIRRLLTEGPQKWKTNKGSEKRVPPPINE